MIVSPVAVHSRLFRSIMFKDEGPEVRIWGFFHVKGSYISSSRSRAPIFRYVFHGDPFR